MRHTYNPYKNVIDVMEKAMKLGNIDTSMFEILKKSAEGDKSLSSG